MGGYTGVAGAVRFGGSRDCILEVGGSGLKVFGLGGVGGKDQSR